MRNFFLILCLSVFVYADVFNVMGVSSSGMIVQQQKLQAIAENIANMNTYKASDGSAYKRKSVVVRTMPGTNEPFVSEVNSDQQSVQKIYDPSNPMADADGFVSVSGYSLSQEMSDMAVARRMYEANAAIFSSAKQVAQTIMNIGK
ncbi:MAG: flagellar basal body rod C-terminal domain-containing protein [Candidatus Margulisbacteria bacterium]|nr:flagellar basal body rod C-terminal domain-containing protein [Candidatus Margulisiibacteriota bacterium]